MTQQSHRALARKLLLPLCIMTTVAPLVSTASAETADMQEAVINFDIPAGSLANSLNALARQAGLTLSVQPSLVTDKEAAALKGSQTAEQALQAVLAGSGLVYRFTGDASFTVEAQSERGVSTLAPVTVYGAKTTSSLEDTTTSVGVVSSETLEQRDIRTFREAFRTLGNVMDGDWTDAGFVIRGVNSEGLTPGGDPLASLYIDGVRQTVNGARRGARGTWDVEQIEVYRGPQSTLSGRASLAGAVYLKTKDPTFEPEAAAKVSAGSLDTREGAVMASGPLVDNELAYRIAAEYQSSKSDINYPTYERFDSYDEFVEDEYYQVRGKLLWLPEALPNTNALLTYSFSHDSPTTRDIGGPVLGFDYDDERGDFNLPVFAENRSADTNNLSLELTQNMGPGMTFTSLTAWTNNVTERPSINKGTPGETNIVNGEFDQSIVTQEFRLNYQLEKWRWVTGVYGAWEESDAGFRRPDFFGNSDISRNESDTRNYALFGEVEYEFIPTWRAVVGGRVDYTDREQTAFFSRNGAAITDDDLSFDETVFLPKLGLIKQLAPRHTLGFTVQEGYRSGGSGVLRSTGMEYDFDAEKTLTYELSYKGASENQRLQVSANIFYTDWDDQQVEVLEDPLDPASSRITNAASSVLQGAELQGRYAFTDFLSGFASIGYVDSEFKDFEDASLGDLGGFPFPEAPEWNAAAGFGYQHSGGFFAGVDAKYLSKYLARFGQEPQEYIDGYTITNAQVGYGKEAWTVTVFAENLFDREYFVYNDRNATGDIAASLGEGRVAGVSFEARF